MHQFIPKSAADKLEAFAKKAALQKEQVQEAVALTTDTIVEFLKRQMERGNWDAVQEILRGKPMTKAGKFLVAELKSNLISRLILRLGLRKIIAVGLVLVLFPIVLAQVAGYFMAKTKHNP